MAPDVAGDDPASSTADLNQLPSSSSSATVHLPTDTIIEILTRLRVKPLLRFKSVSKSFKTLIASTEFVKRHLKHLKSSSNNQLLLVPSPSKLRYSSCTLESLYEIPPHPRFSDLDRSPFLIDSDRKPYWLVGSCDGLICVAVTKRSVALWNPSTGAYSTLPQLDDDDKLGKRCYPVFGFGYDSLADDYKVVSISCYPNKDAKSIPAQVYSMKSRVWKRIEDFKYGLPCNYPGKYVNNTLNWLMDNESSSIVSLDLHSETYREVTQPEEEEGDTIISHHEKTIGVVEDCLCVMYHRHGQYSDLWVMKEFGVTESWAKLFRIDMRRDDDEVRRLEYFMPVDVSGGKALLWLWSSLAVYSYEDGSVLYRSSDGVWSCQVYVESLVSPGLEN
ncbi:F-box/kelch-repeat protein At3g23880 [Linum grandiflorum]